MMWPPLLGRYLTRLFLLHAMAVLFGLASLLLLLEMLDQAGGILARGGVADMGRYVLLRLPGLLGRLVPLAVLVGGILSFRRLAASLEMTAIRAAGFGPWRVFLALLPACVLAAVVQFALLSGLAPRTERAWMDWWDGQEDATRPVALSQRLWLRDGADIVAIDAISQDGRALEGVLLVRRDARGQATVRIDARRAVHDAAGWSLEDVRLVRPDDTQATTLARLPWPEGPPPRTLRDLARPTEDQPFGRLLAGFRGEGPLTRGPAFFATRLQSVAAAAVEPLIMILLGLSSAFVLPRQGGGARQAAMGLALGLGFLAASGLMTAMGETGRLGPALAAWIMPACFAVVGLWCLQREAV